MTSDAQMPKPATLPAAHDEHDRLLVARFSSGDDLTADERDEAGLLLAGCRECRALADDLRHIAAAVGDLPAPRRPRDFRIPEVEAERLRGSRLRRFLQRLTLPGAAALRPLAGSAMALGLTLAVVGVALPAPAPPQPSPPSSEQMRMEAPVAAPGASMAADELVGEARIRSEAAPAAGAAASAAPRDPLAAEGAGDVMVGGSGPGEDASLSGEPPGADAAGDAARQESVTAPTHGDGQVSKTGVPAEAVPLTAMGLLLAVAGALVLALVWAARRVTADPLLR